MVRSATGKGKQGTRTGMKDGKVLSRVSQERLLLEGDSEQGAWRREEQAEWEPQGRAPQARGHTVKEVVWWEGACQCG